ncbi:PorP/SprF family type IX secretion system membrane protein [Polluticoccus soli]|uniref:PorP/SprF family type IX secretion system membrane protein n=1 Tax=Polluticoccus soli TaxID=3034150 RepID=UPI0023E14C95|nr:PorP/SprF family type IX secretion system membrane protein [Flavipsychrobacter sp. JY13-12]
MKKILLGASAAMLLATTAMAQDPHYTQYFASPLTLNPALTGLTQCDLRLAANYRNQWASVSTNPYITGTVSFDMATMKDKLNNGDAVGFGVIGLFDRSGLGGLQNITIGVSAAYHKAFGVEKQHTISGGIQGSLVQKNIDFTKLKFEDQFDRMTGSTPYNTSENVGNSDLTYPDFNLGLMYSGRVSDHATAYAGLSVYHLTQPVESFLGEDHKIHSRYTGYLGGSFDLNENIVLFASGLYQTQAAAHEILAGAAVGFVLNPGHDEEFVKNTLLYLGGWYRYGDAVSPYIGFEWSKMKLGISYDVNVSSFSPATNGNGGYEISLIFNGCINKREFTRTPNVSCPRF